MNERDVQMMYLYNSHGIPLLFLSLLLEEKQIFPSLTQEGGLVWVTPSLLYSRRNMLKEPYLFLSLKNTFRNIYLRIM